MLPSLFEEQIEHEALNVASLRDFGADSLAEASDYFPEMETYNTGPTHDLEHVAAARAAVSIPLAVKIGPYFSSLPYVARRLAEAGVDGIVLFNRFLRPDIDLDTLSLDPHLELSSSWECGPPLQWIAILRDQVKVSLAATSGVHSADDALKLLLAGADTCIVASTLLQRGPEYLETLIGDVRSWLADKEYASVEQLKGSMSRLNCPDPRGYERSNYGLALVSFRSETQ